MEKRVFCQLNGNRKVIGILRGYDVRSNIPLDPVQVTGALYAAGELGSGCFGYTNELLCGADFTQLT